MLFRKKFSFKHRINYIYVDNDDDDQKTQVSYETRTIERETSKTKHDEEFDKPSSPLENMKRGKYINMNLLSRRYIFRNIVWRGNVIFVMLILLS